MKKILILILFVPFLFGFTIHGKSVSKANGRSVYRVNGRQVSTTPSTPPACSGDASNGDNESFESGTGAFCTTDWSESDTDGVIDTYSTTQAHTGTHSAAITSDSDSANTNYIVVDLGAEYTDIDLRLYVYLPTLDSGQYIQFGKTGTATDNYTSLIQWYNSLGTYQLKIRGADNPAEYFNLSPGAWYRLEYNPVTNSTCSLKVYNSSEVGIETSNGGGDYVQTCTGYNRNIQYLYIDDYNSTSTGVTFYVDDVKFDVSAGGEIGAQE